MSKHPYQRITHKGHLIDETGKISALCFDVPRAVDLQEENYVQSPQLNNDVDCKACRAILGLTEKDVGLASLLKNNLEIRLNIIRSFADISYWNNEIRKPDEAMINPDPDGEWAKQFIDYCEEFNMLLKPWTEIMERHFSIYGWADTLESDNKNGQSRDKK